MAPMHTLVSRWAAPKTVAALLDCSASEVRARMRSGEWRTRRLRGRKGHKRIALGRDGWPLGAAR